MEQEYQISTAYKIIYGILAAGIAAFMIFLWSNSVKAGNLGFEIGFSLCLLILCSFFVLTIFRKKVTVSDDQITVRSNISKEQAYLNDIQGFRNKDKGLITIYLNGSRKKMNIYSSDSFANSDELKAWLNNNLRNLDTEDYEAEKALILQDNDLAFTEGERTALLAKADKQTIVFNMSSLILFIASIFVKSETFAYGLFITAFPFFGLIIIAINKGLVKLYSKKNSAYPSIFLGILFSSGTVIFQSVTNNTLLSIHTALIPLLIGAIAITLVFALLLRQAKDFKTQVFAALLISLVISAGAVRQANRLFDQSEPNTYSVKVERQYIYRGKSTSYHIVIAAWELNAKEDDLTVSSDFYNQLNGQTEVKLYLKPGALKIPWYYISL